MGAKDILITQLERYGFPVILQGSMSEDEAYPDSFFTFFNNDSYDSLFFDNVESVTVFSFDVNFYSVDPETVNDMLREVKRDLKSAGFIVDGLGYDLVSDEPTHTGRGIEAVYVEKGA